jgi:alcohol dehydrogenase (cytochrome c)
MSLIAHRVSSIDPDRKRRPSLPRQQEETRAMRDKCRGLVFPLALGLAALAGCSSGSDKSGAMTGQATPAPAMASTDGATGKDWPTYHGTWQSYHFSDLNQINTDTVKGLDVAWTHDPGRNTRGLQSMPLVEDGILYYSGSYSRLYALDGATGKVVWSYLPQLDEALIKKQTHSPYNRGVALGDGKVFVGTMDGRLIAVDQKTGKKAWDTKLINSEKLTVGFTGAPLFVKQKNLVIIGAQGGEWPYRGPIFAIDASTGQKKWEFLTVAGTPDAMKTWGNNSWRTGGGGGWMPGTYDADSNTLWWGTANPAPLFDWSGADYMHKGARPGDNLYTTSVIALDPDTGRLKFYHQELPHDAWDFDSAVGEFLMIDRDGKKLVVHPNKSGYIFVYDRADAKLENVWRITENSNFVKNIDPKTGELIGRRDFNAGPVNPPLCPAIDGGVSWNAGSYDPRTGTYFKVANEWCMDMKVVKTRPILEPQAQLNLGADFHEVPPPGADRPWGHVDARDPVTGKLKWTVKFREPPIASLLATAGNLVFVPDAEGVFHAYDSRNGKELWSHRDGPAGHQGGTMTYMAGGKQYVAVVAGWGGMVTDGFAKMFGQPFDTMPHNTGVLTVYALK